MSSIASLGSLFGLTSPVKMISPTDTVLPFTVSGIESFPNSDFIIEVRTDEDDDQCIASSSVDDGFVTLPPEVLENLPAVGSKKLHMRLVPYPLGYALAEHYVRFHPFYEIKLILNENEIHFEIPNEYRNQSDDALSLQITSEIFHYVPKEEKIIPRQEVKFEYTNRSNHNRLQFGSPLSEYDIAILIQMVDGVHRYRKFFPIRTEPLILGNIHLSQTQLLQGRIPSIPQIDFIHNSDSPPIANLSTYNFQQIEGDRGIKARPVLFNRGKWKVVCICPDGSCNRFGVKVVFSSEGTDDDYHFLLQHGFFDDIEPSELSAGPEGLEYIFPQEQSVLDLTRTIFDVGISNMLKNCYTEKFSIEVGTHNYESPRQFHVMDQEHELFEIVCDQNGDFQYILFMKGMPCPTHKPNFFFEVNGRYLYSDSADVNWERHNKQAIVTFPKIKNPITDIELRIYLPASPSSTRVSQSIGEWRRE